MAATKNRDRTASSSPPASSWILLDCKAGIADASTRHDDSTAGATRSNGEPIEVSLLTARPPAPSRLFVRCPGLEEADDVVLDEPCIVATAAGFLLLRVTTQWRPSNFMFKDMNFKDMNSRRIKGNTNDYFVYRPGAPSLRRLEDPHPVYFQDFEVALLPREEHFTVAALSARIEDKNFDLHLFRSEDWTWSTEVVAVDRPWPEPFPLPVPKDTCRLFQHTTSNTITVGGERGTVGFVDLWRGILLCDLLADNHNLRDVPMPPVQPNRLENGEAGIDCCPKPFRGIAVVGGSLLKVVELDIDGDRLPKNDPETEAPNFRIHEWTLTTYTKSCKNGDITGSWCDWVTDCAVKASDIEICETARSGLQRCGIPWLENTYTCQPVPSLDDNGVVYLITRLKFMHPKAWLLAVDMRNNRFQAMHRIPARRSTDVSLAYCASTISRCINATTPDDSNLSADASHWVDAQRLPAKAIPSDESSPRVNPEEEVRNGETTSAKVVQLEEQLSAERAEKLELRQELEKIRAERDRLAKKINEIRNILH